LNPGRLISVIKRIVLRADRLQICTMHRLNQWYSVYLGLVANKHTGREDLTLAHFHMVHGGISSHLPLRIDSRTPITKVTGSSQETLAGMPMHQHTTTSRARILRRDIRTLDAKYIGELTAHFEKSMQELLHT
jgi:hypothetical protein